MWSILRFFKLGLTRIGNSLDYATMVNFLYDKQATREHDTSNAGVKSRGNR